MNESTAPAVVREEKPEDYQEVRRVNEAAFGRPDEAELVEALRDSGGPALSLVALHQGRVAGHIFFSPLSIESQPASPTPMDLAPMAVLPELQNRGIGSLLVTRGLQECLRRGFPFVFVVGHPRFYPRFGFFPASSRGLRCEYPVPDDVFLNGRVSPGSAGRVSRLGEIGPAFARL